MAMDKKCIIDAVVKAECPMLETLNLKTASKKTLITHLKKSCCPVLEQLSGVLEE